MLDQNESSQFFRFRNFVYSVIERIKSSINRNNYQEIINDYISKLQASEKTAAEIQYKFINDFYIYYQSKLYNSENYGFDFSDMIYYANKYISVIKNTENLNFEYLIIDEYQDISEDRYILAKQVSDKKCCQSSSSRR